MKNIIIIISLLLILSACGGGGGGGGSSVPSQFVGVWDVTSQENGLTDEYYFVIRADGTGADYDYLGDTYNNFADCYWVDPYTVTPQGRDSYLLEYDDGFSFEFTATVENNVMTYTVDELGTFTATRTDLQESDLTPDCNDGVAIGGGGGEGNVSVPAPNPNPTLDIPSEYLGVWDMSSQNGDLTDEYYTVFRADATGADYNYAGDTFDNFGDCYWIQPYNIIYQGGENFSIEFSDVGTLEFTATVANDVMTITFSDSSTFTAPRSNRQESEFTPAC